MPRDVVVVGASAGGVESLQAFLTELPPDLPATVLIVLHLPATGTSLLPDILRRSGGLRVLTAPGGDGVLRHGEVLVAPPDHHLMLADGRAELTRGPRENGHRPAVDVLFRSAARCYGGRTIAVVLSGALDDGTAGAAAVRRSGGLVLVQDPTEALFPSMPQSVLDNVGADRVASAAGLGRLLSGLCRTEPPAGQLGDPPPLLAAEVDVARLGDELVDPSAPGRPAGFACPSCDGTLFEIEDTGLLRFRCRVGHAWSAQALLSQQADALDRALWMALRALEEKAALSRQMAHRAEGRGHPLSRQRYVEQAGEAARSVRMIRRLLQQPTVDRTDGGPGEGEEQGG